QHTAPPGDPRWAVRPRDDVRDRAGGRVPFLPPPGVPDGAGSPPLRARRVARVHRDRPVLDRGRTVGGVRPRPVLRGLPGSRGQRMTTLSGTRVAVVGLGASGHAAARVLVVEAAG